jgi:hypothetical protein
MNNNILSIISEISSESHVKVFKYIKINLKIINNFF